MNWQSISSWWARPFNAQASASSWIMFTGFILVIIFLWTRVLHEAGHVVSKAASAV